MNPPGRPIVIIFDENWAEFAAVFMICLIRQVPTDRQLTIFALVPEKFLGTPTHQRIASILSNEKRLSVNFVSSPRFEEFAQDSRFQSTGPYPAIVYLKIFMSTALPSTVDQVIYIDVDMLAFRSIVPLLDYILYSPFAACMEIESANQKIVFQTVDRPYFNAGIFITSLNYWRGNNAEEQMISKVKEIGRSDFPDQDILNWFFLPVISPLPPVFNVFSKWFRNPGTHFLTHEPLFIQYSGIGEKPWFETALNMPITQWWRQVYRELFGHDIVLQRVER